LIEQRLPQPKRLVEIEVDGETVSAAEGATLLEALRRAGNDQPTLCYLENLTPVNTCRVCVVEVEGSRTLVPSCSREVEEDMVVSTDSDRVAAGRKMVFEFLAGSVDLSLLDEATIGWMESYNVDPTRFPEPKTVAQPVKVEDDLYIRDYAKCILCYRCVEACGEDAQNTFAISVAGRGFDATISTEFGAVLPDSACVYCGNCIGVCPTGALMFRSEFDMRRAGTWDESKQKITRTICPYCGVGCNLELHVQDNEIVKVTSPLDHSVTSGHLCIKGRFGFQHVQQRD
jgi:predicted molibdopterin-dependent oxidoreductase YjgC